jgi:Phage integrase, N-terminal SAM-like domain
VVAVPPALIRVGIESLPAAITAAGADTSERFIEFFTANIRNRNTRMAYALAVRQFFGWYEQRGLGLEAIRPRSVAAYVEQLGAGMAKPSVKQHLAAIGVFRKRKLAARGRPQSRDRRTDQDSGAHAATLYAGQSAERIGAGRDGRGGEKETSLEAENRRRQSRQEEVIQQLAQP